MTQQHMYLHSYESLAAPPFCIAGPGMNPPHVDTILVKNYYEFFSENLGIDSTRDRYRESFFSSFATIRKKKLKKKSASCT
jgi:hypothetical protein